MKNLLKILTIAGLFTLNSAFSPAANVVEQYCNARFNYCISFPISTFKNPETSANGDGFQANSTDGEIFMSVAGSFNVMDWSLEDIYYFNFEEFKERDEAVENVESVFEADYSINVFTTATEYIFYKTMLMDDKYVTITISAPLDQRERVEALRNEINLVIKV